jgi:UDP-N-acetylglucosamine transferase subunit ALG13
VRVVVSLGTDHHPFPRLLSWARSWARPEGVDVLAQTGETPAVEGLECRPYLAPADLDAAMASAVAVVCHGGPGTILQARQVGQVPIVVARRPELGEHVDGHQVRFARWIAQRSNVLLVETEAELHEVLDGAVAAPSSMRLPAEAREHARAAQRVGELVDEVVRSGRGRGRGRARSTG